MTLVLRPVGRGNWAVVRLQFTIMPNRTAPAPLVDYATEQRVVIDGRQYRVVRIEP